MRNILAFCVIACASVGAGSNAFAADKTAPRANEIIVAAAASLTDAMDEVIDLYNKKVPSLTITPTYGSSGSLQKQIEQGAPIDAFISAAPKQMQALADQGLLVAGTRRNLLKNRVVLIVGIDKAGISGFADAGTDKIKQIALGEPTSVPAGQYAAQIFAALGLTDAVRKKAVYAKDVRQVLAYVESGEVDAGVVYATDAATSRKAKIIAEAPAGSHEPVVYPAAVIVSSARAREATAFLDWLAGAEAAMVFARYGFAPAGD